MLCFTKMFYKTIIGWVGDPKHKGDVMLFFLTSLFTACGDKQEDTASAPVTEEDTSVQDTSAQDTSVSEPEDTADVQDTAESQDTAQ